MISVKIKAGRLFIAAAALLAVLCGCSSMSAEDFYALPQPSEGYIQLQGEIDAILREGAEYLAPSSGSNRQAVQFEDIDGDGVKEAIVFMNLAGDDKPLKLYIFRSTEEGYELASRIEGEGSGIESVIYTDMDGDGVKEIAVGWQIASGMNTLCVYTMRDFQSVMIINTYYTRYIALDLNGDGKGNIVALRLTGSDNRGEAEMYSLAEDGEVSSSTALLSAGCEALRRVRTTSRLIDGAPSVLIESTINGSGIITDILAVRNGTVVNVTLDDKVGASDTVRSTTVYCRDMNEDDVLDVPKLVQLPSLSEQTSYYIMDWYNYKLSGRSVKACTTYTNYSDYWYLTIPDGWHDLITVRRQDTTSGERAIIFSYIGDGIDNARDFLVVYTLSGDNKAEHSSTGDRFILDEDDETIYAAEILVGSTFPLEVSEELVRTNFRILYTEWQNGET